MRQSKETDEKLLSLWDREKRERQLPTAIQDTAAGSKALGNYVSKPMFVLGS